MSQFTVCYNLLVYCTVILFAIVGVLYSNTVCYNLLVYCTVLLFAIVGVLYSTPTIANSNTVQYTNKL